MTKRYVLYPVVAALILVLCGCGADGQQPPETQPPTVEQQTVTEPATEPEMQPETVPATEPVTEPTEPEPTEVMLPPAQRIGEGVTVWMGQRNITAEMQDDNHYTRADVYATQVLRVTSEEPFASLYIEWDKIPGEYTLVWDGAQQLCGQYDFLHEYIALPEPVREVSFVFTKEETGKLCNLQVFTEGAAPEGIQIWLPPADGTADILVFPTHSDDDVLFFGPLISYYAVERGLTVQTAFMVEHHGYRERNHERLDGLWEMGVRHYPILGTAPDTGKHEFEFGLSYYEASDIPGWQTEQIRRFKPLVVIGHDLQGEYGNCGHKVNAYYLTQTVLDAADPEKYPESAQRYGTWETPKLYLHLYPENEWYFDVNTPMENDPQGRTPFEAAEDAFGHHHSQNQGSLRVQQEDDCREYDCRPFGLYYTLVGQDTAADVMDHIDPEEWR